MQVKQKKSSMATFIRKLIQMMESDQLASIIRWDRAGTSICVISIPRLESLVLPIFFRHSKFASFVRQLNMYGFSKCKTERGVASAFSHPHFTRDHVDFSAIHKRGIKNTPNQHNNPEPSLSKHESSSSVAQQKQQEVDVAIVGFNSLQYASTELSATPQNSFSEQPQINELLGDLEQFLENKMENDLLWSSQIIEMLNEPRYRRIKGNILGLWEIEGQKTQPITQSHIRMEFIL